MTNRTRVVVYGSLKAGQGNHTLLQAEDTQYLGRMRFPGRMVSLGWFPAVTEDCEDGQTVLGEVYEVSNETLMSLDVLEGHPSFYERKKIETPWKKAWTYFMPDESVSTARLVQDGIWEATPEELEWDALQDQA